MTVGYHKLLAYYFKPFGFSCYTKEKVCHTHIFHFLSIVTKRQHRGMNKGMDNLYNIKHLVSGMVIKMIQTMKMSALEVQSGSQML